MRKAQYLAILVAFILSRESICAQEFPTSGANAYRELLRAAFSQLERFTGLLTNTKIRFLADGGGDGGSSGGSGDGGAGGAGGSSGEGGSSGDGGDGSGAAGAAGAAGAGAAGAGAGDGTGGDGTGSSSDGDGGASSSDGDGASASASDAASAAASATSDAAASATSATSATSDAAATDAATTTTTTTTTDNDAPSNDNNSAQDPDPDPPSVTVTETTDPTNQNTITVTTELAAIEDQATTNPRGGSDPEIPDNVGIAPEVVITTTPPGGFPRPGAPLENIEIHAVIVSAAQSPWDAVKKVPGVGTITVVGGIVALGKTPIQGEIPGGGPQPAWLRLIPDLRLLNGSMIPPVVPNIMDIRWLTCPIKVEGGNL
jgi:hypothetical protein